MPVGTKRALFLVVVGLLAMAGDLTGQTWLYGLGLATHASPAPRVFTARDGLEGFSADYVLHWDEADGSHELALTPEVYAQLDGPYNRRNVYGAALAGGPFLSASPELAGLHEAVAQHAFCRADVLGDLGVEAAPLGPVRLVVHPREDTVTELPLILEVACS
jgi:hypothetical protein